MPESKKDEKEKPEHRLSGVAIGLMDCPDCETEKPIRVNRNGNAYFDCREVVDSETGERCYCSRKWGRVRSAEMIKDYEEANRGETSQGEQQDGGSAEVSAEESSTQKTSSEETGADDDDDIVGQGHADNDDGCEIPGFAFLA
ncbi:hypothetical protein QMT40_001438 [Parvibaculaceae bacterium PLY_AMNH_Bact1]|nr:hypothetical protein QMT40_001438 [Parvibaculaceae bacterium PLY_AMNH_Bact1]